MSSAGQAAAVGFSHGEAVAAYLAVQGITGEPLHALELDATVISLALETADQVDDLRCELSDGSVLLLQAKRECGADDQLRSTVSQWVAQALDERGADGGERPVLVGIVSERFAGKITALPEALRRRRRAVPGVASAPEGEALAALTSVLSTTQGSSGRAMSGDHRERLLDMAFALRVDAREPDKDQFGAASAWLAAVGVENSRAGLEALQQHFRTQTSRRGGSTVDEWLTVLAEAGHPVAADPRGRLGQLRMAERRALEEYRHGWVGQRDRLVLSPLAGQLPPMHVPELLSSYRVDVGAADDGPQRHGYDLATIARCWGRLVITGLPGAGKSCALEQLAAAWADHPDAPIPVLVRLKDAAADIDTVHGFTLEGLVDKAVTRGSVDRGLLVSRLTTALRDGEAALLLDGLDECGTLAGAIADGIADIAQSLPATTGIVMTTRRTTSREAEKLGLPAVELETPSTLRTTLRHLVRHAGQAEGHAADSAWVMERQAWVENASASDRGLWSVPLLATLMALRIVDGRSSIGRTSRARLIAGAVTHSAQRWLEQEHAVEAVVKQQVMPAMVVEGFAVVAHALAGGDVMHRSRAVAAVEDHLRGQRWNRSLGDARAVADAVVDFWDRHVGAFVVERGIVEARAVHLVEIGDGMWAVDQDHQVRDRWVGAAIDSDNRRESVVLAAGLSEDVLGSLVEAAASAPPGSNARRRALEWSAAAAVDHQGGPAVVTRVYERLIDALSVEASATRSRPAAVPAADSAHRRAQEERDGPSWRWVRLLAGLPLPPATRARRENLLGRQPLDDEQRVTADALRLVTDTVTDGETSLPAEAAAACRALLRLPVPPHEPGTIQRSPRRAHFVIPDGPRLLSGHVAAAVLLARFPQVLDEAGVEALHRLHGRASLDQAAAIRASLKAHGLEAPPDGLRATLKAVRRAVEGRYRWFYAAAAACGSTVDLDRASRWDLAALRAAAALMHLPGASIPQQRRAAEADPVEAALVVGAVADAHGIDRQRLAAQARYVADAGDEDRALRRDRVMLAPSPAGVAQQDLATALPPVVVEDLLDVFVGGCALLADTARDLIYATGDPEVGDRLLARVPDLPSHRRWMGSVVGVLLSDQPAVAAEQLLASSDGPTRAGAAAAARYVAEDGDPHAAAVVERSRLDADLTVRLDGGAEQHEALHADHWSCPCCASKQPLARLDCGNCPDGARPGGHPTSPTTAADAPA